MLLKRTAVSYVLVMMFVGTTIAVAGNKKIMSTRAARVLAERAIVESVYGLKIRSTEEVVDMVAANFVGKTESKTSAEIQGIKIDEVVYDAEKDIAQATASISIDTITNIDGQELDLKGKTFKRVAFATSTPANAGPLRALRAAELDGYKNLVKTIVGFTLESKTTVENYILTSDIVKVKVMATTYLADLVDYGWDEEGNAFVKFKVTKKDIEDILGASIPGVDDVIEVEGHGAQVDDYSAAKAQS
ncbi:hypothetical protein DGMP_06150 [Desulfomarina profundi]|uniref:Uncharacterized protein n=1 Tax=Desulfomarina profundi TaxID=2772557 RepID=A0A8D5FE49_9BACT|nr:hypothetical protein [Desulfomarina profundi]BCL59922.1 hypothetical protein DGMP_06150 [Desulfomarina profundi]